MTGVSLGLRLRNVREKVRTPTSRRRLRWAGRPTPTVRESCGDFSQTILHRWLDRVCFIDGVALHAPVRAGADGVWAVRYCCAPYP